LIRCGWLLVVSMTAGMLVTTYLWLTNRISDRVMVGLGMLLGWRRWSVSVLTSF
jgi:hypothetical protein